MKNSSDRIQTSHGGSLPRPDDLIEANAKREAGTVDEAAFQKKLTEFGGRRRAPPGGRRHHGAGRRRVRQVDGPQDQLPRLVELFVLPAGQPQGEGARALRHAEQAFVAGQHRAVELRRPARPPALRHRLRRSRVRRVDRAACARLAVLRRADQLYRPQGDRRRHRQLQGGACGQQGQRRLHDLDRAGELRAHRQRALQERRRVRLRLRRRHARGIQGDRRRGPGAADRRSRHRREFRPDQSRADGRGLPQVHGPQSRR